MRQSGLGSADCFDGCRSAWGGQLGEHEAAVKAVRDLLKLRPDFAARVRNDIEKWWDSECVEHLIDGLRKAGWRLSKKSAWRTPIPRPG